MVLSDQFQTCQVVVTGKQNTSEKLPGKAEVNLWPPNLPSPQKLQDALSESPMQQSKGRCLQASRSQGNAAEASEDLPERGELPLALRKAVLR